MASLSLFLIGAPGAGKSTVFQALTNTPQGPQSTQKGAHHMGSVKVPDTRLERLNALYNPKKYIPAEVSFVDVALPSDQSNKLGSLTSFLADADAFVIVVQAFGEFDYQGQEVDPAKQMESVLLELVVADLEKVEKRLERIQKEMRAGKGDPSEIQLLEKFKEHLEEGKTLRDYDMREDELAKIRHYAFLSLKPIIVVANVSEDKLEGDSMAGLEKQATEQGLEFITFCASLEAEIAQMDDDDRTSFLSDYGIEEPARARLLRSSYKKLSLISFFTVGDDEVRAWTINEGDPAVEAAGKIHTDIQRGFIRAETVHWDTLLDTGSWSQCRDQGTLRLEGKQYVVKDGDVISFRFNV